MRIAHPVVPRAPAAARVASLVAAAAMVASLMLAASARAQDNAVILTSENFQLVAPTLSGGGGVDLQSTAADPTVSALGTTIGQSSPLGVSTGSETGIVLQSGFWPIVANADPGPIDNDADGDGVPDAEDNCPFVANDQAADADADGIGDACECGDFTGDGFVNSVDARLIQRCSVGLFACAELCDVTGEGGCNSIDARLVQRFAVGILDKSALSCPARPRE